MSTAYPERKQMKIQTTEESFHWMSYNMKQCAAELKQLNATLLDIAQSLRPDQRGAGETPF